MKNQIKIILYVFLLSFLSSVCLAKPLELGDMAPEIKIKQWLNGSAQSLSAGKGKTIFVVEFWATWCGPCKASIPHLSDIYNKKKDKNVEIIGISNESFEAVKEFVKEAGFTYNVGIDDDSYTTKLYMDGIQGIPHAFIVGKEGKILWKGHPMDGLEGALDAIIKGEYNIEEQVKLTEFKKRIELASQSRDIDAAIQAASELLAIFPNDTQTFSLFASLCQYKGDEKTLTSNLDQIANNKKTNAATLNNIAWNFVSFNNFKFRNAAKALECARKSIKLERQQHSLDTLARIYFELGLIEKSITLEEEALKMANTPEEKELLQQSLNYYLSVKEIRNTVK